MRNHANTIRRIVSPRLVGRRASLPVALLVILTSAIAPGVASAAVTHEFLPALSAKVSEGVPAGSPVGLTGPVGNVGAVSGDSGHVWLAEILEHEGHPSQSRVDEFSAVTGEFLSPHQLNEEDGLHNLGFAGIATGDLAGEEEKYVTAGQGEGQVIAAYGAADKLQTLWSGAGTFNGSFTDQGGKRVATLAGVAVDRSKNLETGGDLYVSTRNSYGESAPAFQVVDVFAPETGGREPTKTLGEIDGTCKEPGVCAGAEVTPFQAPGGVAVSGFNSNVFVIDKDDVVDVFEPVSGMPGIYSFRFSIDGTPARSFTQVSSVAADAETGNIYVSEEGEDVVAEFGPTGQFLGQLSGTRIRSEGKALPLPQIGTIGVDSTTHNVFVGALNYETGTLGVDVFGPDVVIPDVATEAASEVEATSVKLDGTVNPDKEGEASCRFVWGSTTSYGSTAACEPEEVGEGGVPVAVHAVLHGLEPDSTYCYRLEATNGNGTNSGEARQDQCFTTAGPGIHGESVSDVSSTSTSLRAAIDPNDAATTYYFQYGRSGNYEHEAPLAPGVGIGSGKGSVEVERHLQGLAVDTTYHYRVVVVSEVKAGAPEAFYGPDQTFTTQGTGASLLPDARQWELVSPANKHGAIPLSINEAGVAQVAASGDSVTYDTTLPTESVPGYLFGSTRIFSARDASSWSSHNVALPHPSATGLFPNEFHFFSQDLSYDLAQPFGEFTSLAPEVFPPDTENTPYLRHASTCEESPDTCYTPLLTSTAGYSDVPIGTEFGEKLHSRAEAVAMTPDGSHVILSSSAALTAAGAGSNTTQLYEWSANKPPSERLQMVSVLPGQSGPPSSATALGAQNQIVRGALSNDGSRVFWSESSGGGGHLYMSEIVDGTVVQSVKLDTPEAQCLTEAECGLGAPQPVFQLASTDGSRVFFEDKQRLTRNASKVPGQADLYECEIIESGGKPSCQLSDLTPATSDGEAARVQGAVIGASEDGSRVYFVADAVLGDGAQHGAVTGENLYTWHEGETRWIAALATADQPDWVGEHSYSLNELTARVSPDGRYLAFMSQRSLTGYDNQDAVSGQSDEEVFLYDSEGAGDETLVCASCDPTGARPQGVEYGKTTLVAGNAVWDTTQWIAANIPGWTPYGVSHASYQSRYLSNSGRLFFNSSDPLVPQDVNKNEDVYEYEPIGVGDCSSSEATYSELSDGCTGLVSSGTAAQESAFLDASETGDDVFFLTGEKLVSQDYDTSLDLYDAHMCSAAEPCFAEPALPPACTTADACRSAPLPQPAIFGAPSSSTFTGTGNSPAVEPSSSVASRVLSRAHKLTRALSACRRKRSKRARAVCERRARKQYGKAKSTKRGKRR